MLDPDRKVIVFDVPGTGDRRRHTALSAVDAGAAHLSTIGRTRHERVHIMGVSWGGAIAQQFAVQLSNGARKLVPRRRRREC